MEFKKIALHCPKCNGNLYVIKRDITTGTMVYKCNICKKKWFKGAIGYGRKNEQNRN